MLGFELIAALAFIAFSAAVCVIAFNVPLSLAPHFWAGAGAFPFILGAIILFLSAIWAVDMLRKRRALRQESPTDIENPPSAIEEILGPQDRRFRLYIISLLTVGFVFILIPFFGMISNEYGFMGATFVFTLAGLKLFSTISGKYLLLTAAVTAVCVYAIFTYGLSLPMPR